MVNFFIIKTFGDVIKNDLCRTFENYIKMYCQSEKVDMTTNVLLVFNK